MLFPKPLSLFFQGSNVLPRGSPYTQTVNRAIIKLYENGELERMTRKWFLKIGRAKSSQNGVYGITMAQVALAMATFLLIAAIALAIFLLECTKSRIGRQER